jgi:hypothetical protein
MSSSGAPTTATPSLLPPGSQRRRHWILTQIGRVGGKRWLLFVLFLVRRTNRCGKRRHCILRCIVCLSKGDVTDPLGENGSSEEEEDKEIRILQHGKMHRILREERHRFTSKFCTLVCIFMHSRQYSVFNTLLLDVAIDLITFISGVATIVITAFIVFQKMIEKDVS